LVRVREKARPKPALCAFNPRRKEGTLTVTVVICTRNRPALLEKCLAAVAVLDPAPEKVLVIDNSEGDKETERAAGERSTRYLVEPIPGLSHARNRGLAECDTDVVAFLDDDAVPSPGWLGNLIAPFADEKIAASTGRVVPPGSDPSLQPIESPRTLTSCEDQWFERATFGGMGIGCSMALRRSACAGWTVFDERLGRGAPFHIGEESYAFAGLLSRGYAAVYLPNAIVFHAAHKRYPIEFEARNSFAYWLLLFTAFPAQRINLLRFIVRRIRRQPIKWPRETQEAGDIVSSNWRTLLKAGMKGAWLYLRTPNNWNLRRSSRSSADAKRHSDQEYVSRLTTRSQ
jgi:glycosyltransferase involved in cell wall biosynthesis